jgi:anaerobic selenocysteine-containing dehydrogenase
VRVDVELRARLDLRTAAGMGACRSACDIYAAAAAEYSPERVAAITGVDEAALANAAAILGANRTSRY